MPLQIRALRKARDWTQQELAKRSGLPQASISRAEDVNYGKLTINTLLAIADGFDAALVVRIVPFSRFTEVFEDWDEGSMQATSFEDEDAALRERGQAGPIPEAVARVVKSYGVVGPGSVVRRAADPSALAAVVPEATYSLHPH